MRLDRSLIRHVARLTALLFLISSADAAAPRWQDLDPAQQALIAPTLASQAGGFDQLPEARRQALALGASRWLTMTPEQKKIATHQLQEWQSLSGTERKAALAQRERFRQLSPAQQKSLLEAHRQFMALPAERQQELRNRFTTQHFDDLRSYSTGDMSPGMTTGGASAGAVMGAPPSVTTPGLPGGLALPH